MAILHEGETMPILHEGETEKAMTEAWAKILQNKEDYTKQGSVRALKQCKRLYLEIVQHCTLQAQGHFPSPKYVPPCTVINIQNNADCCFEWAVILALYPAAIDLQHPIKYKVHLGELD